jgi:basic membrane protein A
VTPGRLLAGLALLNAVLIAIGMAVFAPAGSTAGSGVRIGLVFDVGGKNDRSFNESAWRGLVRARDELGVQIDYIEPSGGADRGTALQSFAARGEDLVIGVGWMFSADLEQLAQRFPNVKFAGIDYAPSDGVAPLPNLAGLRFREQEGSFVVGAIAGMLTQTKTVGFVGGMKTPLIRKFEVGYIAGVHHVCADCRVLSAYAGTDGKAFADPPLGQELAVAQYGEGADIIYHAAGKTGDGVFAAARQRGALAIGVDSDQFNVAPCCVVTSMVKHVDVAVVDLIRGVVKGQFHGGLHEFGLAEHGVTFVADAHNQRLLPLSVVQRAKLLADQIIAGAIKVPFQ